MEWKTIIAPVVVGDTIYTIQPGKCTRNGIINERCVLKGRVCQILQKTDCTWKFQVSGYDETGHYTMAFHLWFFAQDIGKTVFFTEDEALKAL